MTFELNTETLCFYPDQETKWRIVRPVKPDRPPLGSQHRFFQLSHGLLKLLLALMHATYV